MVIRFAKEDKTLDSLLLVEFQNPGSPISSNILPTSVLLTPAIVVNQKRIC